MVKKIIYWSLFLVLSVNLYWFWQAQVKAAQQPVDFSHETYVGSESCVDCHKDRHRSWSKTYHRTMTQEATAETVAGDFNGEPQTYWGYTIRPVKRNGRFYFAYYDGNNDAFLNEVEILRTVGSRRYQQYLTQTPYTEGNFYRLELLWHIEDQRWIHLNGAFLDSDQQSFSQHNAIWNQNCIFCHNTGISPGMTNYDQLTTLSQSGHQIDVFNDSRFQSEVKELGISCESCHAPAKTHTEVSLNPIRKYYLHFADQTDPSIVHPQEIGQQESLSVCGQCHGQRTPKDLSLARTWMESGPTFRPGDDLEGHVNPVYRHSQVAGQPEDVFAARFWADGTPRLTAYEYQGIMQSACQQDSSFTCMSCHDMHGGDPKGMIEPEMRTNQACVSCHQDYVASPAEHTGHAAESTGSLCYDCHMPKMTYGIMTFHRNHRIESPVSHQEMAIEKPNACVACHLDQTDQWLFEQSHELWQQPIPATSRGQVQSLVELHSGDPVQRALAAYQMAHQMNALPAQQRLFLIPHLLLALEDSYPAIRRFAHKALMVILQANEDRYPELIQLKTIAEKFDFIADQNQRAQLLGQMKQWQALTDLRHWPTAPEGSMLLVGHRIDFAQVDALRAEALRSDKVIHIGE
ncbi:ammonia-forming cytochrome c nitrite reductase subunit c552 [Marinicella sediminis]|uniref:Ammonia-forming cytochrome c nitrite reductase subunit c552 n=1 Tax=Marinicella sediminis TaxID=1792834 RepID=A0ABV7J7B8_9GAMM|nr:cytochrome c3 family protein [Marinicella sediminis]